MRICVPTQTGEGARAAAYGHFGSAPYFTLYDTGTGAYEVIENRNEHHAHGACHPLGALDGRTVDAVVCAGMGLRALQRLNEAGIKVYLASGGTVGEVVDELVGGRLREMTAEGSCRGHGCH